MKKQYETPVMEVLEIKVDKGFMGSTLDPIEPDGFDEEQLKLGIANIE